MAKENPALRVAGCGKEKRCRFQSRANIGISCVIDGNAAPGIGLVSEPDAIVSGLA